MFIAEAIQNKVGAFFGVSGTVVVIVVLVAAASYSNKGDQKKTVQRTGTTGPSTKLCIEGQHDLCPGRYKTTQGETGNCACTCHRPPMSALCADLGRHDACEGRVMMPSGNVVACGCTCHRRAS